MSKLYFIINYGDRAHAAADLMEQLERIARESGADAEWHRSQSLEHCAELTRDAANREFDCVVAGGGDGTLNTVLNFVKETKLGMGLLPLGTVNCFAKSVGLSTRPQEALRQILNGHATPIHAARFNERWFLTFGGVGCDAAAVHQVDTHSRWKHCCPTLAFVSAGANVWLSLRDMPAFRVDGDVCVESAHSFIFSQARNYAGFNLFPHTSPLQDGLDAVLMLRRSRLDLLRMATIWPLYARNWIAPPRSIQFLRVRHVTLEAQEPLTAQVDGEPITLKDSRRIEVEHMNDALSFILPADSGKH